MSEKRYQGGGDTERRRDLVKFQAFIVAIIWALVLLALFRPVIFGRVIPAVLGLQPSAESGLLRAEIEGVKPGLGALEVDSRLESVPMLEEIQHVVQEGETLYRIAIRYGVSPEHLAASNYIVSPRQVSAGNVLTIPQQISP